MDELHLRRIITGLVSYSLLSALATACSSNESSEEGGQHLDMDAGDGAAGNGGTGGGGAGGVQVDGSTAGAGGSTAGSGGSGGSGGAPVSEAFWPDLPIAEFDAPTCEGGQWQATDGLNPASPVDFVALRRIDGFAVTTDAGAAVFAEIASTGTPCDTATDVSACEQALSETGAGMELTQSCGGPPFPCQHYVVTTAGDTVERWITKDDLLTFLGPIDTPVEALLLAFEGTFMGYNVTCEAPDRSSVRAVEGGFEVVLTHMTEDCAPIVVERDLLRVATDGTITVLRSSIASVSSACVGRRTDGLVSRTEASGRALGDFFASVAHLEAASVDAFRRLADELAAHGAPAELLSAALDAAADEVRHAGVTRRFAERFGGKTVSPSVEPWELRGLEELACENAAEGCVRETFGALVAEYQARTARDREVACAMRDIAKDEARHAALAWRVAAWADSLLSSEARERVRRARARAIEELKRELEADVPDELRALAGVPTPHVALGLAEGLERALWANPPTTTS